MAGAVSVQATGKLGGLTGLALAAVLSLAAWTGPAHAATFGVPTNLDPVCGQTTVSSANPQGWFYLTSTDSPPEDGELVHQIRLFIEVTGTTLDVRVFDPGTSDARDEDDDNDMRTTYQLRNPCTPFPTCNGDGPLAGRRTSTTTASTRMTAWPASRRAATASSAQRQQRQQRPVRTA